MVDNPNLEGKGGLKVSPYEKVSSVLIALLIMVGGFVALMFAIWLTNQLVFTQESIPVELANYGGGGNDGFERDLEEPGLEEIEEMVEPAIETTLEAVTDVISTQAASFDVIQMNAVASSKGSGMGDSRAPGPPGDGDPNIIPPWERWEIRYNSSSVQAYAKQLDFFKIELGAFGGGRPNVDYASNVSGSPKRRSGKSKDEKRIYMSWRGNSPLRRFDTQLVQKAGISTNRRTVVQFYPDIVDGKPTSTYLTLLQVEALSAKDKGHTNPREFLKTIFGVRAKSGGYEFYVTEQYFRPAPAL